jgi:flagellar basal-body rod modification protein FlgD
MKHSGRRTTDRIQEEQRMATTTQLTGSVKDLLGQADAAASTKRTANKELGKDAFLQLLVSQLKNQDPMKPMDDTSMIAEMAQFSSLEQMQNLNKTMEAQQTFQTLTQASGMIGKYVQLQEPGDHGAVVTGLVSEVRTSGGKVNVVIDGKEYETSTILKVSDKEIGTRPTSTTPQTAATPTTTTTTASTTQTGSTGG